MKCWVWREMSFGWRGGCHSPEKWVWWPRRWGERKFFLIRGTGLGPRSCYISFLHLSRFRGGVYFDLVIGARSVRIAGGNERGTGGRLKGRPPWGIQCSI